MRQSFIQFPNASRPCVNVHQKMRGLYFIFSVGSSDLAPPVMATKPVGIQPPAHWLTPEEKKPPPPASPVTESTVVVCDDLKSLFFKAHSVPSSPPNKRTTPCSVPDVLAAVANYSPTSVVEVVEVILLAVLIISLILLFFLMVSRWKRSGRTRRVTLLRRRHHCFRVRRSSCQPPHRPRPTVRRKASVTRSAAA